MAVPHLRQGGLRSARARTRHARGTPIADACERARVCAREQRQIASQLEVDKLQQLIMRSVDEDVDEVELNESGAWRALSEAGQPIGEFVEFDDASRALEPPIRGADDAAGGSGGRDGDGSAGSPSHAAQSVLDVVDDDADEVRRAHAQVQAENDAAAGVISLLDSDDEEPPPAQAAPVQPPPAAPMYPGGGYAPPRPHAVGNPWERRVDGSWLFDGRGVGEPPGDEEYDDDAFL